MTEQPITDEAVQAFRVAERTAQGFRRSPADRVRAGLAAAYPLLRQLDVEQTADFDQAVALLADLVAKCTDCGSQDGGFVASYLLPTGPVHRAIPWLEQRGITVRPGFDGRTARDDAPGLVAAIDSLNDAIARLPDAGPAANP